MFFFFSFSKTTSSWYFDWSSLRKSYFSVNLPIVLLLSLYLVGATVFSTGLKSYRFSLKPKEGQFTLTELFATFEKQYLYGSSLAISSFGNLSSDDPNCPLHDLLPLSIFISTKSLMPFFGE
jgi:hypothetical protein